MVWALSPNSSGLFARALRFIWCCRRRFTRLSAWLLGVPLDRRRDILRARLELMHHMGALRTEKPEAEAKAPIEDEPQRAEEMVAQALGVRRWVQEERQDVRLHEITYKLIFA